MTENLTSESKSERRHQINSALYTAIETNLTKGKRKLSSADVIAAFECLYPHLTNSVGRCGKAALVNFSVMSDKQTYRYMEQYVKEEINNRMDLHEISIEFYVYVYLSGILQCDCV